MKETRFAISIICALTMAFTFACPGSVIASEMTEDIQTGVETSGTLEATELEDNMEEIVESSEEEPPVEEPEEPIKETVDPISAMGYYPVTGYAKYKGKNTKKIPVITYHYLCSKEEKEMPGLNSDPWFTSTEMFDAQMAWLYANGYRTLSMDEFYKWKRGKMKLPKQSVLITFDDGKYSSVKYGVPILAKYGFKATMFLVGADVGGTTPVNASILGACGNIGADKINEVRAKYPNYEFHGHSYNMHYRVNGRGCAKVLSYQEQLADFNAMKALLGTRYVAYPFGDFNKKTIKAAKKSKMKLGFKFGGNALAKKGQNKYKISRIMINGNEPMEYFTRWFY